MDNIDELIVDVALGRNGRKDYYAGRNIEAEMEAIARGEEKVIKTNKRLAQSNKEVAKSGFDLNKAFRTIAAYIGVKEIIKYADAWTGIKSTLSLITNGEKERLSVQQSLYDITQRTRQDMLATVDLYAKLTTNAKALNLSQEKRLQLTETINKALVAGGGTPETNKAVLLQFGQALGIGKFQGQDLKSILQNNIGFAQTIATGLGVDVGQLPEMGQKGQLTADKIVNALLSQSTAVDVSFRKMNITVEQSLTNLKNAFGDLVNGINEATSFTNILAKTILFVADNLKLIAKVIIPALLLRSKLLRVALINGGVAMRYMEMRANKLAFSMKKGTAGALAMGKAFIKLEAIFWLFKQIKKFIDGEDNIFVMVASIFVNLEKWFTDGLNQMPEKLKVGVKGALDGIYDLLGDIFGGIFGYFGDLWRTVTGKKPMFLDRSFYQNPVKTPNAINTSTTSSNATINQNNYITVNEARQGTKVVENAMQTPIRQASDALGFTPYPRGN